MQSLTIDLDKYAKQVPVLAGRDRGELVRSLEGLEEAMTQRIPVTILIPDYIASVNSSFFLAMLERTIKTLGETEFRRLYTLRGPDAAAILDDGIRTALLMGSRFRPVRHGA